MEDYEPEAHYDRITDAWDLIMGDSLHYGVFDAGDEPLSVATDALTGRMIEASALSAGLRVLDVGCGTGGPASRLVREHGVEVLGITTSSVGIAAATQRAHALGLVEASFEKRDATDNGLPDASFDRVFALESSHLMADRRALVDECARVLRRGGRLVLCDIIRRREIPFLELRDRRHDYAVLRAAFGSARMDTLEQYAELATDAGLEVDLSLDLTDLTRQTFARWQSRVEDHRAEVTAIMGADGVATFESALGILDGLWDDGTLGYGIFSAVKPD